MAGSNDEIVTERDISLFWEEIDNGFQFNKNHKETFPTWFIICSEEPGTSERWHKSIVNGLILCKKFDIFCYCHGKETCKFCEHILRYYTIPQISSVCSIHNNCENDLCMGKIIARYLIESLA